MADPEPQVEKSQVVGPGTRRRFVAGTAGRRARWWSEPRSAVLLILALVIGLGGGSRWLRALRSRRLANRLAESDVTEAEVLEATVCGREAIADLFRLLSTSENPALRRAAGRSLAVLWKADQLVAEEEKAVVVRGFDVSWKSRRRYPRGLSIPIPIEVTYGLPFLESEPEGVRPDDLEWSHHVRGTNRVSDDRPSPWKRGPGSATFQVDPGDFATDGPHRLVLVTRVRPAGLTSDWVTELPQVTHTIEFDPHLAVDALLASPDEGPAISRGSSAWRRTSLRRSRSTWGTAWRSPSRRVSC